MTMAADNPPPRRDWRLFAALLLLAAWFGVTRIFTGHGSDRAWLLANLLPVAILSLGALAFGPPEWRWPRLGIAAGSLLLGLAGGAWQLSPDPWYLTAGVTRTWRLAWLFGWIGVVAPVGEELYFRGLLQDGARARFGRLAAVLAASLVFTLVHVGHPALWQMFALGLAFALFRELTGTLAAAILAHIGWNLATLYAGAYRPWGYPPVGLGITALAGAALIVWGTRSRGDDAGAGAELSGAAGQAEPAGLG